MRWVVIVAAVAVACADAPSVDVQPVVDSNGLMLVIGDWGAGTRAQTQVAEAIGHIHETTPFDVIVTTGDNFYNDDEASLMRPWAWAIAEEVPFWIAWGNHDVESRERIEDVNRVFDEPPRWGKYSWGSIDVIVLDSTQVGNEEQAEFLESQLADSSHPTIVVTHHPPYSCTRPTPEIVERWLPLFDDDVFLVLSGHEHSYQRLESDGISYVVTGGGGAGLQDLGNCATDQPETQANEVTHHFVTIELTESGVRLTAYRPDLSVIEQFDLVADK